MRPCDDRLPAGLFYLRPLTRLGNPYLRAFLYWSFVTLVYELAMLALCWWAWSALPGAYSADTASMLLEPFVLIWLTFHFAVPQAWPVAFRDADPELRPGPVRRAVVVALSLLAILGGLRLSGLARAALRHAALEDLVARSAPLVEAIERFDRVQDRAPRSLDELVPEFLPTVPDTGLAAFPAYGYGSGREALQQAGHGWTLSVRLPAGSLEHLVYAPRDGDGDLNHARPVRRYGAWVHTQS